MLNKYYLWFEEGIEDPNTVIDEVFRKIRHKLLPLKKLNTN
jgi:general stress protein 26